MYMDFYIFHKVVETGSLTWFIYVKILWFSMLCRPCFGSKAAGPFVAWASQETKVAIQSIDLFLNIIAYCASLIWPFRICTNNFGRQLWPHLAQTWPRIAAQAGNLSGRHKVRWMTARWDKNKRCVPETFLRRAASGTILQSYFFQM